MAWLGSNYVKQAFNKPKIEHIVYAFERMIKDKVFSEFDGIACTGTSGLAIAPILAYQFDKHLMVVRKPNDGSHKESSIETHDSITKYIIVDDFACSGNTLNNIVVGIANGFSSHGIPQPSYLGCFFWYQCWGASCLKETISGHTNFKELTENKIFVQVNEDKKIKDSGYKPYCIDQFNYDEYMEKNK